MLRGRFVLPLAAIQTGMRGDALALMKDFYQRTGCTDIDTLAYVCVRARIVLAFNTHMVVELHRGLLPLGVFIGQQRQGLQERRLFFQKYGKPGTIALLERRCIELFQKLSNGVVHLDYAEEFFIAEFGDDVAGHISDISFDSCLVLRGEHPGRQDCRSVVVSEFLVGPISHRILVLAVGDYPGLQVVGDQEPCCAAKELNHVDVGVDPRLFLHVCEGFGKAIHAEGQRTDEDVCLGNCTSFRIVQL